MKISLALRTLGALASQKWGLVTAKQALQVGVQRMDLVRLVEAGHYERMVRGVYRNRAVPVTQYDGVRTSWLLLTPGVLAYERLDEPDAVITGMTAAWLHGIGDFQQAPYEISTTTRKQSIHASVRLKHKTVPREDVTLVHGLPATSVMRTLIDLVVAKIDPDQVGDALHDAIQNGGLELSELETLKRRLAHRHMLQNGKEIGPPLFDDLVQYARVAEIIMQRSQDLQAGADAATPFYGSRLSAPSALEVAETVADIQPASTGTAALSKAGQESFHG